MDTKSKQDKAWKYREGGEPMKALAINYGLFYEYEAAEEWEKAINVLVDISISWSVLGRENGDKLYFQAAVDAIRYVKSVSEA